jgi:hypothetical protein
VVGINSEDRIEEKKEYLIEVHVKTEDILTAAELLSIV